jgi:hypothetical protein
MSFTHWSHGHSLFIRSTLSPCYLTFGEDPCGHNVPHRVTWVLKLGPDSCSSPCPVAHIWINGTENCLCTSVSYWFWHISEQELFGIIINKMSRIYLDSDYVFSIHVTGKRVRGTWMFLCRYLTYLTIIYFSEQIMYSLGSKVYMG